MGKIHKEGCFFILLTGTVKIGDEHGAELHTAPKIIESPAGAQRAFSAVTDTCLATIHAYGGTEKSASDMADTLTVQSFEEFERYQQNKKDEV